LQDVLKTAEVFPWQPQQKLMHWTNETICTDNQKKRWAILVQGTITER